MTNKIMLKSMIWLLSFCTIIIFITCEKPNYPPKIWDPNEKGRPTPVIHSVDPPNGGFSGIEEITIIGENFSLDPEEILVFFDGTLGTILSASDTQIVVLAPNISGDSLTIKVAVVGAFLFAEYFPYKLEPAVIEYGTFGEYDDAYGLAVDSDENVYVSLAGNKIVKVTPDGEQSDYATTTFSKASSMKYGPEGYIYYVNLLNYVFRVDPGGGTDSFFAILPGGAFDLDFDSLGNIYAGGSGNAIYTIKPDGSIQTSAYYTSINIITVRVYKEYVYVAGKYEGTDSTTVQEGIWRNQILSPDGELGSNELVFDWADYVGETGPNILTITFTADGDLFIGGSGGNAITILHPDGTLEPLFPTVLSPPTYMLSWGNSTYLYANRRGEDPKSRKIIRITAGREGAPYYGRE